MLHLYINLVPNSYSYLPVAIMHCNFIVCGTTLKLVPCGKSIKLCIVYQSFHCVCLNDNPQIPDNSKYKYVVVLQFYLVF